MSDPESDALPLGDAPLVRRYPSHAGNILPFSPKFRASGRVLRWEQNPPAVFCRQPALRGRPVYPPAFGTHGPHEHAQPEVDINTPKHRQESRQGRTSLHRTHEGLIDTHSPISGEDHFAYSIRPQLAQMARAEPVWACWTSCDDAISPHWLHASALIRATATLFGFRDRMAV